MDVDEDGRGEHGFLTELSGVAARAAGCGFGGGCYEHPFLSTVFGESAATSPIGIATDSGYHFRMFLPRDAGTAVVRNHN